MQYVLNEMAEVLGRESGFIQRKRKFTGVHPRLGANEIN
jgi:hypothetical protein